MIRAFEQAARSLGAQPVRVPVPDEDGASLVTSTVDFDGIRITAIARQGFIQLVCAERVGKTATAIFALAPPAVRRGWLATVRLAGSGGRSMCHVVENDDGDGSVTVEVFLEQRVFMVDETKPSLQRMVDGLIEIESRAVRLRLQLQTAADGIAAHAWRPETNPHEAMYG